MTTYITDASGLPWCGECISAREHVNNPDSRCYDCKRRNKFAKAVEQNSTEPDFDSISIEKVNQYLREHGYDPEKVGLRGKILSEALIENINLKSRAIDAEERANELLRKTSEQERFVWWIWAVYARNVHDLLLELEGTSKLGLKFSLIRNLRDYTDGIYNGTYLANAKSMEAKRDLSDAEIEELGAREAEERDYKTTCLLPPGDSDFIEGETKDQVIRMDAEDWILYFGEEK